uniref:Transglycosylase SLT domain-containing protein n=1 Tax=Fagus sylvatica TaxID=28930 RepID=A0A2N9FFQ5_FAGSY
MAVSFRFWDDCIDPSDMEAMWRIPEVSTEWLDAGESRDQRVHLSRDPDGQPYLTQTEMKAVAEIIVSRHFDSRIDLDMICAIAELESDRQPLAIRSDRKTKKTTIGIMQLTVETAEWLFNELGYRSYEVLGNPELLYRPFVSVYLGAAHIKWLSNFEQKKFFDDGPLLNDTSASASASASSLPSASTPISATSPTAAQTTGVVFAYWDTSAAPEDMEEMWNHPEVLKEWTKSGERQGKVRFSHDDKKKPYLSRVELKTILCALAEVVSMRFINGVGPRTGIMGIDYSTAFWLYMELGYRAYRIDSADDLAKPFVSMYFGAAYLGWLSEYEGRERTPQFIVQAYIAGPKNVNLQETGPLWLKFTQALGNYEDIKKYASIISLLN